MIHGDPLPSRRGCLLPAARGGLCRAVSLQRVQSWGQRGARRRILGQHPSLAVGSRSTSAPGHMDGSTPDDEGRAPPPGSSPKPVTSSGHVRTHPRQNPPEVARPDTHTELLKTGQVMRCWTERSSHSPGGLWARRLCRSGDPGQVPGYPRDTSRKRVKSEGSMHLDNTGGEPLAACKMELRGILMGNHCVTWNAPQQSTDPVGRGDGCSRPALPGLRGWLSTEALTCSLRALEDRP